MNSETLLSIGEVDEKTEVTIRTLQYYDKAGLLKPTCMSQGGRRLYSDKDIVKLNQILFMKSLGFSLNEIKNILLTINTPAEIAHVLQKQKILISNNDCFCLKLLQ